MGTNGTGLYADDTACDVRDAYRDALRSGADGEEAEARVLSAFAEELSDPDERAVVLLALADTQSRLGRLTASAREEALALLRSGGDLDRWQEAGPGEVRRRAAVLRRLQVRLEGPQPGPRPIRARRRPPALAALGQVYVYRARSGQPYLLRVVGLGDVGCSTGPVIRFLDHPGPGLPDPADLAEIPERRYHPRWKRTEVVITDDGRVEREHAGLVLVGEHPVAPLTPSPNGRTVSTWAELSTYLETRDDMARTAG
ncbi:hypothetical protein OG689_36275 [Kitasatospora sp. NBC_00240]|uniref:hypothetical protein n=1 Tax=Kitasatospora sp. NBC_00240 TaxID=2903567 RepID=UPI00225A8782|nr:hypothetical protein [Kitasatospora sp. NBC_00240]MCX5214654.1 hypothetical protein [Kitasatospora sp. NBC_00240]